MIWHKYVHESMKIAIGVTGASGAIYARLLINELEKYKANVSECGIVFSASAIQVWETELGELNFAKLPFRVFSPKDFSAPFASGSAGYDAMIICPCSMGTLGRIAGGVSDDLMTRSADVMLKERKKLILVTRESPLNLIHIRNMEMVTSAGAIVLPASPSFYSIPQSIDQLCLTVVHRAIQLCGIETGSYQWGKD